MQIKNRYLWIWSIALFNVVLLSRIGAQVNSNVILRVGVIDLRRAYDAAKELNPAEREIEKLLSEANAEIVKQQAEIQELKDKRKKAVDGGEVDTANDLMAQIKDKETVLKSFHQEATEKVRKLKREINDETAIQNLVSRAVRAVAYARGYTLIFSSNSGDLIYWTDKVDITDEVIAQVNRLS